MEKAFNPFPDGTPPPIQAFRILLILVSTLWCPNQVAGLIKDPRLPFEANEAFIGNDIAERELIDDGFGSQTFIQVRWHQIVDHGQPLQCAHHDQFVAKGSQVATGTEAIIGAAQEVTLTFTALIAAHRCRFGIQQEAGLFPNPELTQPRPSHLLNQARQLTCTPIELALIQKLWKQV